MNNLDKQYIDILSDAYKNYCKWFESQPEVERVYYGAILPTIEEFINEIKTDDKFATKFGIQVYTRELSLVEMIKLAKYENEEELIKTRKHNIDVISERLLKDNIPTKTISLTYNNQTIEIYEQFR